MTFWCIASGAALCAFGFFAIREGIRGQRMLRCRVFSFRHMQRRVVVGAAGRHYGRAWISTGFLAILLGGICFYHKSYFVLGPLALISFLHAFGMAVSARHVADE